MPDSVQAFHQWWNGGTTGQNQILFFFLQSVTLSQQVMRTWCAAGTALWAGAAQSPVCFPRKPWRGVQALCPASSPVPHRFSVIPTTFRGTSRGSKRSCPGASSSQRQGTMTRCHVPRHLCPQLTAPRSHNLPPGEPQLPPSPFSQQEHRRSTGWSSWFCCGVGCVWGVWVVCCFGGVFFFFFSAGCFLPDRWMN